RRSMIASAVTKAQKDKKPTKVVAALKNAQPPANFLEDSAAGLQRGFSALRPEEILALTSAKTSTNDLPPRLDSEMRGLMQRAATWLNAKGNAAGTAKRSDVATDQAVEETLSRAIRTVASTVDDSLEAVFRPIIAETTSASPLSIDLRRRVGLTGKLAASSQDVVNQWKLTKYGYVWEDYYRPMTFESVLLSITAETHDQRSQKVLRVMESLGVLAAGFVGLGNISRGFARPDYAERVAFTTGVLLPEARRIFGKDIAKYLNNLATTALPSVLTLEPHQSRDGYVFFPRGPIFGYGVDEFSTEEPTYIVNIDSDDVAVEGEIVSASTAFQSGYKDVATQVSDGKQLVEQQLVDFAEIEEKLNRNRVGFALNDACRMLAEGDKSGASARLDAYINADGNPKAVAPIRERIAADLDCSGNALTPPATDTP
ncbi:MAG TPA: hypothetical protein VJ724_13335, partial [Tahibacter sp.]|nr:hypothetical protein [Tahibacter sp.]